MNHVLLGASIPFALCAMWYGMRGGRASVRLLVLTPLLMMAGALWAVAPDLPRLWGKRALYDRLAREPRCDLFFWHYTIDQIESPSPWYAVGFVLLPSLLLAAAWRELRLREEGTP